MEKQTSHALYPSICKGLDEDYYHLIITFLNNQNHDLSFQNFKTYWKRLNYTLLHYIALDKLEYSSYIQIIFHAILKLLSCRYNNNQDHLILNKDYIREALWNMCVIYILYITYYTQIVDKENDLLQIKISPEYSSCLMNVSMSMNHLYQYGIIAKKLYSILLTRKCFSYQSYSGPTSLLYCYIHLKNFEERYDKLLNVSNYSTTKEESIREYLDPSKCCVYFDIDKVFDIQTTESMEETVTRVLQCILVANPHLEIHNHSNNHVTNEVSVIHSDNHITIEDQDHSSIEIDRNSNVSINNNQTVSQTLLESTVSQPLLESTVSQPILESNVIQPILETTVNQPILETTVSQPILESTVNQPILETTLSHRRQVYLVKRNERAERLKNLEKNREQKVKKKINRINVSKNKNNMNNNIIIKTTNKWKSNDLSSIIGMKKSQEEKLANKVPPMKRKKDAIDSATIVIENPLPTITNKPKKRLFTTSQLEQIALMKPPTSDHLMTIDSTSQEYVYTDDKYADSSTYQDHNSSLLSEFEDLVGIRPLGNSSQSSVTNHQYHVNNTNNSNSVVADSHPHHSIDYLNMQSNLLNNNLEFDDSSYIHKDVPEQFVIDLNTINKSTKQVKFIPNKKKQPTNKSNKSIKIAEKYSSSSSNLFHLDVDSSPIKMRKIVDTNNNIAIDDTVVVVTSNSNSIIDNSSSLGILDLLESLERNSSSILNQNR